MVILEPAAAEVVAGSAAYPMKEALDEAAKRGVSEEAARAFMLGHIQIPLAILFGEVSHQRSDAAKIAIEYGQHRIFRSDWKDVSKPVAITEIAHKMLHPEENARIYRVCFSEQKIGVRNPVRRRYGKRI